MKRVIYKNYDRSNKKNIKDGVYKLDIKALVEIAIFSAIAIVLDKYIKIPIGATGGSINISMVPLIIICLRHGPFKGFIASGIIYSLVTSILDAWGFEYFVFDYLIAFGSISIVGLFTKAIVKNFKNKKVFSFLLLFIPIVLWFIIRVLSASVDSMLFYNYTFIASIAYNASYVGFSAIADLVISCLLLPAIISVYGRFPTSYSKTFYK